MKSKTGQQIVICEHIAQYLKKYRKLGNYIVSVNRM